MNMPSYPSPMPVVPAPPQTRVVAPSAVVTATRLMFARAGLGVLSLVLVLATKDSLTQQVKDRTPSLTSSQVDTAVGVAVVAGVVFGLVYAVLYTLLAVQVGKGKRWAQIVTIVLSALGILSVLGTFVQPASALATALNVVILLLSVAILTFVLRPQAREFFTTPK